MDKKILRARIEALIQTAKGQLSLQLQTELYQGTLSVLRVMYGPDSSQEKDLRSFLDNIRGKAPVAIGSIIEASIRTILGALKTMLDEIDSGFIGSLQLSIMGELLTDLVKLAREVINDQGDDSKNVAAVLTAAAFEDTLRRLATVSEIPHKEKLADVLTSLKDKGIFVGTQIGVAQSYLNFRNNALHAQWSKIDMTVVHSVLAFTEQILLKHFT